MNTLTSEELYKLFESSEKEIYRKKGRFLCRAAKNEETVLTIVSGKLETLKKSRPGDIIIRNIEIGGSAETYVIDDQKFNERYDLTHETMNIDQVEWTVCHARGRAEAFCYLEADPVKFVAPWGEEMICYFEDFVARPIPGDPYDIYRIERATFDQTYEKE